MYALLVARDEDTHTAVLDMLVERPYLQIGGNETIGQGWFLVNPWNNDREVTT